MPRPTKRQKATKRRGRNAKGQILPGVKEPILDLTAVELNCKQVVPHESKVITTTATTIVEPRKPACISDKKKVKNKRLPTYTGILRATRWRKSNETAKVDPTQPLINFGFTFKKTQHEKFEINYLMN